MGMMLTILILQAERVKVKPIFYDGKLKHGRKLKGSLVTLSSNTVVMDLKLLFLKEAEQEELCEIEESSMTLVKEANIITLNVIRSCCFSVCRRLRLKTKDFLLLSSMEWRTQ